jgi:hypothetical protein
MSNSLKSGLIAVASAGSNLAKYSRFTGVAKSDRPRVTQTQTKIVGISVDTDNRSLVYNAAFAYAAACSFDSLITTSAMLLGQAA